MNRLEKHRTVSFRWFPAPLKPRLTVANAGWNKKAFQNEAGHINFYEIARAPRVDFDQTAHPRSLTRVFAGHSNGKQESKAFFFYVSYFEILSFDPLLSYVHNWIAVEFLSKPLKSNEFETEVQSTKSVND